MLNSSLDVSVFSTSPTSGTSILTLGLQTVVIPIREVGAPRSEIHAVNSTTELTHFSVDWLATSRPRAMAEPEAMPADAIVHEMDTPESEEDACSWRALMETLAVVGDPPKRGSARSDDVTSEEPSIVAPFVSADAVPARWGLHVSGAVHGG